MMTLKLLRTRLDCDEEGDPSLNLYFPSVTIVGFRTLVLTTSTHTVCAREYRRSDAKNAQFAQP